MRVIWRPAIAAAALFAAACSIEDELQRIPSPSGKVTAILTRDSGAGAMDPYTYDIRLESGRARVSVVTLRWVRGEKDQPAVDISWRDDQTLVVSFLEAEQIIGYRPQVRIVDQTIAIVLLGTKTHD